MKKSQLEQMIRNIVKEEFELSAKKYMRQLVPMLLGEALVDLIDARLTEQIKTTKQSTLTESTDYDDWPSITSKPLTADDVPQFDRSTVSELLGYGDVKPMNKVALDTQLDSGGNPVPIRQPIPDSITKALNKDYSEFMKTVNTKVNNTRPMG